MTSFTFLRIRRPMAALLAGVLLLTEGASPLAAARQAESFWENRRRARPAPLLAQAPEPAGPAALPSAFPLGHVTRGLSPRPALLHPSSPRAAWAREWDLSGVILEEATPLSPDVVIVKDLHAQEEAQRRIADFLSSLAEDRPVLVGVEGASGPLNFRPYRALGDPGIVRRLADAYLSWDWIQAPEYAGLTGPDTLRLFGVEDPTLYEGNVEACRRAEALRPRTEILLRSLSGELAAVKSGIFTPAETDLDEGAARYRAGALDTGDYLALLAERAALAPGDRRFPQTLLFLRTRSAERALDFTRVETQRAELLERLAPRVSPDVLRGLEEDALLLRRGDSSSAAFHAALLDAARQAGVDPASFPDLQAYARYAAGVDLIDRAALMREVEGLENAAWRAGSPTPAQEALRSFTEDLALAERLATTSLTEDQWIRWESRLPSMRTLSARARSLGMKVPEEISLAPFEAFYRYAKRRDAALLKNLMTARRPGETAVLVAGGFHAAGLTDGLRKRGLSAAVLVPRLEALDGDKNALAVFSRGPSSLDRLLLGRRIFLAKTVGLGLGAPRPGPGYAAAAGFPLYVGAISAAENPSHGAEILDSIAAHASQAGRVFPLQGPFPAGRVRKEHGRTVIPLSVRTPDGTEVLLNAVTGGAAGGEGRQVFPPAGKELKLGDGGGNRPFSLRAVPTRADKAAALGRWLLPSLDAAVFVAASYLWSNPWAVAASLVAFRFWYAVAAFLNERGHLLRANQLSLGEKIWSAQNLRGNLPWKAWAAMLVPFMPSLWGDPHVMTGAKGSDSASISRRGWLYGAALVIPLAQAFALALPEPLRSAAPFIWAGVFAALLVSAPGDLLLWNVREGLHACGINVVMQEVPEKSELAALSSSEGDSDAASVRQSLQDVKSYLFETGSRGKEFRGHHSMGMALLHKNGKGFKISIAKAVNRKRDQLTKKLIRSANPLLKKIARKSIGGVIIALAHWRVSTSSAPTKDESHPFQWTPNHLGRVWGVSKGVASPEVKWIGNSIGANGDFNYFRIFGKSLSNGTIKKWLARVLGVDLPLKGDSPAIAGMIDLFHARGMWDKSLRLAYQLAAAKSAEDPAPSDEILDAWSDVAEKRFESLAAKAFPDGARDLREILPDARENLARGLLADVLALGPESPFKGWIRGEDQARAFVEAAIDAFLNNDLNTAARKFLSGAVGTFGVGFVSSLAPDRFVTASLGQSVFLGFEESRRIATASSDGVVLKIPFGGNGHKKALGQRWYMDNKGGEVVEVAYPQEERSALKSGGGRRLPTARIYSLALKRELTEDEARRAGRLEELDPRKNGYITSIPEMDQKRPVRGDMEDTPVVLKAIRKEWKDPNSFNARTGKAFADMLLGRENPRLILTGFAESRFVLEQFAEDMRLAFPNLHVEVMTPDDVVSRRDSLKIGKDDVILAASHSSQTANTNAASVVLNEKQREEMKTFADAIQDLDEKMKAAGNTSLFTLTGETDCLLGYVTGQKYYAGAPFKARNFTNLAGFRPSEAVTVTTAASQATLTELLIALSRAALAKGGAPHGFALPERDVRALEERRDFTADNASELIIGAKRRHAELRSPTYRALSKEGARLAKHVLEPAVVLLVSLGYLYALLGLHLPVLPSDGLRWIVDAGLSVLLPGHGWIHYALGTMDFLILGFLGYHLSLVLRVLQRRALSARQGKRLIVFADDQRWVGLSMKVLVSKLSALSYGHTGVDIEGGDIKRDYAEVIQHKTAQRGTKLYLGRTDGRLSKEMAELESAAFMAGKQTNTNKHYFAGPETVTVGHNPSGDANASEQDVVLPDPEISASTAAGARLLDRMGSLERFMAFQVIAEEAFRRISNGVGIWFLRVFRYRMHRTRGGARTATTATYGPLDGVYDTEKAVAPSFTDKPVDLPFRVLSGTEAPTEPAAPRRKASILLTKIKKKGLPAGAETSLIPAADLAPEAEPAPAAAPEPSAATSGATTSAGGRYALEISIHADETFFRRWDEEDRTAMAERVRKMTPELVARVATFLERMGLPKDTLLRTTSWTDDNHPAYKNRPRQWPLPPLCVVPLEVLNAVVEGRPEAAAEAALGGRTSMTGPVQETASGEIRTADASGQSNGAALPAGPKVVLDLPFLELRSANGNWIMGSFLRADDPSPKNIPVKDELLARLRKLGAEIHRQGGPSTLAFRAFDLDPATGDSLPAVPGAMARAELLRLIDHPESFPPELFSRLFGKEPALETKPQWLEMELTERGSVSFQHLRIESESFEHRDMPASRWPKELLDRVESFMAFLAMKEQGGLHTFRVSLDRPSAGEGMERFRKSPRPAFYLSAPSFKALMNGKITDEEAFKLGMALQGDEDEEQIDLPASTVVDLAFHSNRALEIVREGEGLTARLQNLDRPETKPQPYPFEGKAVANIRAYLSRLEEGNPRLAGRLALRVVYGKEPKKVNLPFTLTITPEDLERIMVEGAESVGKVSYRAQFGNGRPDLYLVPPPVTSLILLLIPAGILAALAAGMKGALAAVAGGVASHGGGWLSTALVAGAFGAAFTALRRGSRSAAARDGLPSPAPALAGIRPATLTSDDLSGRGALIPMEEGLPSSGPALRPDLILHAPAREAAGTAPLVAAEVVRRRGTDGSVPGVFLVAEGGDPARAESALLAALALWRGPDGPLSADELERIEERLAASPADPFAARDGSLDGLDAGLAFAAAGRALHLADGVPMVLISTRGQGRRWRVPAALKQRILVLELVLPGIASVLSLETWKNWRASAVSA